MATTGKWADGLTGTVAERLRELGLRRILVQMADNGQIPRLRCEMPTCYCPYGRSRFQYRPKTTPFPDWAPNADHYPKLRMDGGHLDPWNVRLAHVQCNAVDIAWRGRIHRMLERKPPMSFQEIADALNDERVQAPHGTNTWSAATARKAYVS